MGSPEVRDNERGCGRMQRFGGGEFGGYWILEEAEKTLRDIGW